jgi:hypothetical protein
MELRGSSRGVVLNGRVLIGRWRGCGIPVGHPSVSRLHAWVDRQGSGQFYIADALSRSGTTINGQPVDGHQLLKDGDEIRIGPAHLTFSMASALPKECGQLQVAFSGASRNATTSGILFACTCGAPLWVTAELAGRQGRCRFCKRLIQIPKASVVPPAQMSTKIPAKAIASEAPRESRADNEGSGAPSSRRPAAPTPMPVAPQGDLIRLDEESDIVDVDSRPAGEGGAGHRTYAGLPLPADAADIVPTATPVDASSRRRLPTPKPREVPSDVAIDDKVDLLTDAPTNSSSSAATQSPPPKRRNGNGGSTKLTTGGSTKLAAGASAVPSAKNGSDSAAAAGAASSRVGRAKSPGDASPPSAVPYTNVPPPETAVWDSDELADRAIASEDRIDAPGDSETPAAGRMPRLPMSKAQRRPGDASAEADAFASLSLNASDDVASAMATGEKPTGLLTSGVGSVMPDSVPELRVTRPPEFPPVTEPRVDVEVGDGEVVETSDENEIVAATGGHESRDVHAGADVFDEPASGEPVKAAASAPAAVTTQRPPAKSSSSPLALVAGSFATWLLSAFTFGIPSFFVGAAACALLFRRDTRRVSVFFALIVNLLGGAIGISVSSAWWLSKMLFPFPWKAW